MARGTRGLKSKVVKTIKHPSGIDIPIALDRNSMLFVAMLNDDTTFEHKEADEVIRQAVEYLDHAVKLDWRPVIEIGSIGLLDNFRFERFYTAQLPSGEWRKLDWDGYLKRSIVDPNVPGPGYQRGANTEMERLRISHKDYHHDDFSLDKLPHIKSDGFGRDTAIYMYTEEKWQALQALDRGIDALKEKMKDLLTTPNGIEQLQMIGERAGMLMAPSVMAIRNRSRNPVDDD